MNDSQLLCEKAKAGVGFVPIYKLTETVAPRRSKRKRFSSSTNISTNHDNNNNNNNNTIDNDDNNNNNPSKYEINWLDVSHDCNSVESNVDRLWSALSGANALKQTPGYQVWLKQEAPIVAICARNIDSAHAMAKVCKIAGIKRSAITSLQDKIILSVADTRKVETLVAIDGQILPTQQYFAKMVQVAHQKLVLGRTRMFETFAQELIDRLPFQNQDE
jgi:tRNA(Phe) wybutosine-synthesizing methylase Tyw3